MAKKKTKDVKVTNGIEAEQLPKLKYRYYTKDRIRVYLNPKMQKICPKNPVRVSSVDNRIEINPRLFKKYPTHIKYAVVKWGYYMGKSNFDNFRADISTVRDYLKKGYNVKDFLKAFNKILYSNITPMNEARYDLIIKTIFKNTKKHKNK